MQEVRNAVENATRDLGTRWDFRNVPASFELNEKTKASRLPPSLISRCSSCSTFCAKS